MNTYNVLLIGIALAMDACGVALSVGIHCQVSNGKRLRFMGAFAFFQFLFAFLGASLGKFINQSLVALPSVLGGIAILIVGILMFREGLEDQEECILVKPWMEVILGISVSIDALVVGITALFSRGEYILQDGILIGLVTFILVAIAFLLSKALAHNSWVTKYADYMGGVILMVFGLKMLFL